MKQLAPLAPALAVLMGTVWTPIVRAEPSTDTARAGQLAQMVFNNSTDPADGFTGTGRPVSRTSGGSRGDCDDQLVALLPGTDELQLSASGCNLQSMADLALTTTAHPTVWIHVPEGAALLQGQFALLNENQRALAIQPISLPATASIVGIPVEASLDMGQTYYWVFSILETPDRPTENPRVEGLIRRVEPTSELTTALENSNSVRDQAEVWADHGIWHEALTSLATLQQTAPGDRSQQDWYSFLDSVGLGAIANTPIRP
ncbi:DUF928 domain-containing protein [Leptothoe spongobia]|uniref:DUF928 domain-containing protein n=1 Tax=Leptothoe spongobia TAU-MAC 1115 TaxID=1967444 RepID=A0A947DF58_9CYAN|nr:DUF928 domain-containing protein [Leptothoe spongobia]MBT9315770.1 DUF928 domain-containing protein [Leptothoe spongobia TAU-MAC 1115]